MRVLTPTVARAWTVVSAASGACAVASSAGASSGNEWRCQYGQVSNMIVRMTGLTALEDEHACEAQREREGERDRVVILPVR
jgi:hypothetical protein